MNPLITEEDPIAEWEAMLLPGWTWQALEKEDEGLYYGRVKTPNTHGTWEYGYFSQEQLEEAQAYRTDTEEGPLYPDGGTPNIYETELEALQYEER